jgi:hypothetical protein
MRGDPGRRVFVRDADDGENIEVNPVHVPDLWAAFL